MATVHLEGCTIEQAFRAALLAWEEEDAADHGKNPKNWLTPIRDRLERRQRSGTRPRVEFPAIKR